MTEVGTSQTKTVRIPRKMTTRMTVTTRKGDVVEAIARTRDGRHELLLFFPKDAAIQVVDERNQALASMISLDSTNVIPL